MPGMFLIGGAKQKGCKINRLGMKKTKQDGFGTV
jgi:hypothetical protein